jgi:hypothetical protein
MGDDHPRWLAKYGQPIREQPTEAADYDNQPLKSLKKPTTSKLWVAGSSPAGRANFNRLGENWLSRLSMVVRTAPW